MKKIIFSVVFTLFIFFHLNAQKASVEKSVFGIETGIVGLWVYNEYRLADQFVLRSELGLTAGFRITGSDRAYGLTPEIRLEPRWYYNLNKRLKKGKKITKNNGNFLALNISYYPDWFVISNSDNVYTPDQITIIPKWGIRRSLGKHFIYETGIGLGYVYEFDFKTGDIMIDVHLRIGYVF